VARGFGERGVIQSICQDTFTAALDAIIAKIADALDNNACLSRALNRDETGRVDCDVIEVIPRPGTFAGQPTSCADLAGVDPAPLRANPDGSIECELIQLATLDGTPAAGEGWYYDDWSAETITSCGASGQRIAFTTGAIPPNRIEVHLDCPVPGQPPL